MRVASFLSPTKIMYRFNRKAATLLLLVTYNIEGDDEELINSKSTLSTLFLKMLVVPDYNFCLEINRKAIISFHPEHFAPI